MTLSFVVQKLLGLMRSHLLTVDRSTCTIPLLILSGISVAGTCPQHSKRFLKALTKERLLEAKHSGPRLCVDLSMTHHMSKKVEYSEPEGGMEGSSLCEVGDRRQLLWLSSNLEVSGFLL